MGNACRTDKVQIGQPLQAFEQGQLNNAILNDMTKTGAIDLRGIKLGGSAPIVRLPHPHTPVGAETACFYTTPGAQLSQDIFGRQA